MSGKGSAPRPLPDREGYEQRFDAIDWNARERDGVQGVHEGEGQGGRAHGPGDLQPTTGQDVPPGA